MKDANGWNRSWTLKRTWMAIGTGVVVALSLNAQTPQASSVTADGTPTTGTASAGTVVVTGSNIPTAEEVTPSNVDTLTDQNMNRGQILLSTQPCLVRQSEQEDREQAVT